MPTPQGRVKSSADSARPAQAIFSRQMSGSNLHQPTAHALNPNEILGDDVQEEHDQQSEVFAQYQCRSLSFGKDHPGEIAGLFGCSCFA
jgi:hypothetical protein